MVASRQVRSLQSRSIQHSSELGSIHRLARLSGPFSVRTATRLGRFGSAVTAGYSESAATGLEVIVHHSDDARAFADRR